MTTRHKKSTISAMDVFARIWACWALLVFVSTMFIAIFFYIPCFLLKEPSIARWHRSVSRVWMWSFLHLIGCPIRVKGKAHFQPCNNYIVVCNHNSLIDVPVSTPFMPRANKTIAKKSFASIPVFGWIYAFGSVLVDRKSDASRRKSYEEMKRMLHIGLDMVIYPEGTRNKTNAPLKSFYDGAFRLATDTKKQVVPTILLHTRKVMPVHKTFYLLPHRLEMHFLPPVDATDISTHELKEKVFKQMWDYYRDNQ